jgi:hypothetical protein
MAEDNQTAPQFLTGLSTEDRECFAKTLRAMARAAGNCALAIEVGSEIVAIESYSNLTTLFLSTEAFGMAMIDAITEHSPKETDDIPELIFRK